MDPKQVQIYVKILIFSIDSESSPNEKFSGRLRPLNQDPNQLQIDAGQERGPTLCLECGTVYTIGKL